MSNYKINPYTGLPPRREVKFDVKPVPGTPGKYIIMNKAGQKVSKILSKHQLDIATQHALNAVSSNRTGKIDEVGQALVNFRYNDAQAD